MNKQVLKLIALCFIVGLLPVINSVLCQVLIQPRSQNGTITIHELQTRYAGRESIEAYQFIEINLDALSQPQYVEVMLFGVVAQVHETNKYDNVCVINENFQRMMILRPPTNNVLMVDQAWVNTSISDILYHPNKIMTDGYVLINNPQGLVLHASNEIVLLPGFEASKNFVAEIVPACGFSDRDMRSFTSTSTNTNVDDPSLKKNENAIQQKWISNFDVYPNPTSDEIQIRFSWQHQEDEINIQLVSYTGAYSFTYSLSKLPNGIYFVVVSNNKKERLTHKIIKS